MSYLFRFIIILFKMFFPITAPSIKLISYLKKKIIYLIPYIKPFKKFNEDVQNLKKDVQKLKSEVNQLKKGVLKEKKAKKKTKK